MESTKFKMFKAGKLWMIAGLTTLAMVPAMMTHASADTVSNTDTVQVQTTNATNDKLKAFDEETEQGYQDLQAKEGQEIKEQDVKQSQELAKAKANNEQAKVDYQKQLDAEPNRTAENQQQILETEKQEADQKAESQHEQSVQQADQNLADGQKQNQTELDQKVQDANQAEVTANQQSDQSLANEVNQLHQEQDPAINQAKTDVEHEQQALTMDKTDAVQSATAAAKDGVKSPSYTTANEIKTEGNLPTNLTNPMVPGAKTDSARSYDAYQYVASADDTTERIVNHAPSAEQQAELNDYALTLINNYRESKGVDPMVMTKEAQAAGQGIDDFRTSENMAFDHTVYTDGHHDNRKTDKVNQIAQDNHVTYYGEDLGMLMMWQSSETNPTMLQLKASIANTLSAMIYEDGIWNNAHERILSNPDNKTMSTIAQFNSGCLDSLDYPFYNLVFNFYLRDNLTPIQQQEAQKITNAQKGQVTNDRTKLAEAQTRLASLEQALTNAINNRQNEANQAKANHAQVKQASIQAAQDAFNESEATLQAAHQQALTNAQATLTNQLQANTDTLAQELANVHDESDAEKQARHVKQMNAKVQELDAQIENLKNSFAADKKALMETQSKAYLAYQASRATARQALIDTEAKANHGEGQTTETDSKSESNDNHATDSKPESSDNHETNSKSESNDNHATDSKPESNDNYATDSKSESMAPAMELTHYQATDSNESRTIAVPSLKPAIPYVNNEADVKVEHHVLPDTAETTPKQSSALLLTLSSILAVMGLRFYSKKHQ